MIKISDIQDKQFIKDMIDLALSTNDKEWFTQLTNDLKELGNKDVDKNLKNKEYISEEIEIDLFNPKSFKEGYDDLLEYEYYICETDCDLGEGQFLAIIDNKIYGNISNPNTLLKVEFIVELIGDNKYKSGDKIPKSELKLLNEEYMCYALWVLGYKGRKTDIENNYNVINQQNELLNTEVENLKKENDLLKSELKTLQDNYFDNKNKKKKFNWKFWKAN